MHLASVSRWKSSGAAQDAARVIRQMVDIEAKICFIAKITSTVHAIAIDLAF
jgi:hypothetical protein